MLAADSGEVESSMGFLAKWWAGRWIVRSGCGSPSEHWSKPSSADNRNRLRLHSALGYRSPEEFEQKTESQAESRSATMEFFENKENNKKNSKGLLGTGTQTRKLCPKKLCQLRGSPHDV